VNEEDHDSLMGAFQAELARLSSVYVEPKSLDATRDDLKKWIRNCGFGDRCMVEPITDEDRRKGRIRYVVQVPVEFTARVKIIAEPMGDIVGCAVCDQEFDRRDLDQVIAHAHNGPHEATGIIGSRLDPGDPEYQGSLAALEEDDEHE